MSKVLNAPDTLSGREGKAYAQINGINEELFFIKKIDAVVNKKKAEVGAVGKRMSGYKTTGLNGTGDLTLYFMSPVFRRQISQYKETGRDVYFNLVFINDDPASRAGKQEVLLLNVNLDSTMLGNLDSDSDDPMTEDCSFTFEDFVILRHFNDID